MKVDHHIRFNNTATEQPSYFVYEQHNVTLIRNSNYGYGIAISGGLGANISNDSGIYISDIVPGGPAENKLMVDDKLLSVNGVNVENVEHSFVIRLLKEAKDFIHLVIKRKINNSIVTTATSSCSSFNNSTTTTTATTTTPMKPAEQNDLSNKRHNLAIQHTAATLISNYTNPSSVNCEAEAAAAAAAAAAMTPTIINSTNSTNLMSQMMNATTSLPCLKPIKISLSRKDNKREAFGVVLGCKYYIKEILDDSVAANEANLKKGDIVLKINDLSYDHVSLYQANKIILKSKESKLNLVVKRNSLLSSSSNEDLNFDLIDENAITTAADHDQNNINCEAPKPPPRNSSSSNSARNSYANDQSTIDKQVSSPSSLLLQQVTPNTVTHNQKESSFIKQLFKPITKDINEQQQKQPSRLPKFFSNKSSMPLNYRTAIFARENGIGIRLAGGNKVGIFICDVQYNSPAERAGLKIADKIIKVNGVDYTDLTREEAVQHILSLTSLIEMCVAYSRDEYDTFSLDSTGGDSFYVRAHFNYTSKNLNDLSFRINDILHITDTLYNGVIGQWVASRLKTNSADENEEVRGTIPNEQSAHQLIANAKTIEQSYSKLSSSSQDNLNNFKSSTTNSTSGHFASARMSIRKKLAKHNANIIRSKSASRSQANSDNESTAAPIAAVEIAAAAAAVEITKANTFSTDKYATYERVVLKEISFTRPVVIFGPLADIARDKLKTDVPNKFEIPDSYSNDPANNSSSGVIKLASIKEIIEKNKHCLLDITPNAVDHLNYAQYFPICIYLRAHSRQHTKELRQKYAKNLTASNRLKSSKRLYENALKLETYYSHLFTSQLSLDSNQWFKRVKEMIDEQQQQPLWICEELSKSRHRFSSSSQLQLAAEKHQQQSGNFVVLNKQNQLIFQGVSSNSTPISSNPTVAAAAAASIHNRFDDNFELPIYANPVQGSSTYSLYEENPINESNNNNNNYRCSYATAASDISDLKPPPPPPADINPSAIYSTNFKNGQNNNNNNNNNNNTSASPSLSSSSSSHQPPATSAKTNNTTAEHDSVDFQNGLKYSSKHNDNWRKFATYSANSLRNGVHQTMMASNNNPGEILICDQNYNNEAPVRNSISYSSYKIIKNSSQSALMIPADQSPTKNLNSKNNNVSSLLQPIHKQVDATMINAENKMNDLKLNNHVYHLRPISKSNYCNTQYQNDLKSNKNSMLLQSNTNNTSMISSSSSSSNPSNLNYHNNYINNNHHQNQITSSSLIKRKKDLTPPPLPAKPAPPTLPKPKFILPQTSTTNLALQRSLKSKSELNIATTASSTSPSLSSSNGSTSSTESSSSSSSSSSNEHQTSLPATAAAAAAAAAAAIAQKQNQQVNQQQNSFTVSSGFHSDMTSWDSHSSSRHSFETDRCIKNNKHVAKLTIAMESKLAKINQSIDCTNTNAGDNDGDKQPLAALGCSSSSTVSTSSNSSSSSSAVALSSNSSNCFATASQLNNQDSSSNTTSTTTTNNNDNKKRLSSNGTSSNESIELPIYYQTSTSLSTAMNAAASEVATANSTQIPVLISNSNTSMSNIDNQITTNSYNHYSDLLSNESLKYRIATYTAHYNDNGFYRKLSLDSNSNCSIIASANGIFDSNGGILESADTGVSLNVPEGAIAKGCSFDLYFKVCHCKSPITNGKGELLTNPIVMCGPRNIKFLKPIELQIPHFITIDGQSWSYAFKASEPSIDDHYGWSSRFHKKTLLNSVTVLIDSF